MCKVSARPLQLRPRARPLGGAGRGVRGPDDGRLSAVPARPGRRRPGRAAWPGAEAPTPPEAIAAPGEPPPAAQTIAAQPRGRAASARQSRTRRPHRRGVIAALFSLAFLAGGTALVVVDQTQQDEVIDSDVPERGLLHSDVRDRLRQRRRGLRRLRARPRRPSSATSASAARAIATSSSASPGTTSREYLSGVEHSVVTNIEGP